MIYVTEKMLLAATVAMKYRIMRLIVKGKAVYIGERGFEKCKQK